MGTGCPLPGCPLPVQLPNNGLGKAQKNDSNALVLAALVGDLEKKLLAPGVGPALAVVDFWGVKQRMGDLPLPL